MLHTGSVLKCGGVPKSRTVAKETEASDWSLLVEQEKWEEVKNRLSALVNAPPGTLKLGHDKRGNGVAGMLAAAAPLEVVKLMLSKGVDPNEREADQFQQKSGCGMSRASRTPLWMAAQRGRNEVVRLLIEYGARCERVRSPGTFSSKFMFGKVKDRLEKLWKYDFPAARAEYLRHLGPGDEIDESQALGEEYSPLYWAVARGDMPMFKDLLNGGGDVNEKGRLGESLMYVAASHGRVDMMRELHKLGCKHGTPQGDGHSISPLADERRYNPVLHAANLETLNVLVEELHYPVPETMWVPVVSTRDADMHKRWDILDERTTTQMEQDRDLLFTEMLRRIPTLPKNVTRVVLEAPGENALRVLIDRGFDVNKRKKNNMSALFHACRNANVQLVRGLLAAGASVRLAIPEWEYESSDYVASGGTLLHASMHGNWSCPNEDREECARLVFEAGCDPLWKDSCGVTGLALALNEGFGTLAMSMLQEVSARMEVDLEKLEEGEFAPEDCFPDGFRAEEELEVEEEDEGCPPLLHLFAQNRIAKAVEILVNLGADPSMAETRSSCGLTPLHYALWGPSDWSDAERPSKEYEKRQNKKRRQTTDQSDEESSGAEEEEKAAAKRTELIMTAETVAMLLRLGANAVHAENDKGWTPLHVLKNDADNLLAGGSIAKLFADAEGAMEAHDKKGLTPVQHALGLLRRDAFDQLRLVSQPSVKALLQGLDRAWDVAAALDILFEVYGKDEVQKLIVGPVAAGWLGAVRSDPAEVAARLPANYVKENAVELITSTLSSKSRRAASVLKAVVDAGFQLIEMPDPMLLARQAVEGMDTSHASTGLLRTVFAAKPAGLGANHPVDEKGTTPLMWVMQERQSINPSCLEIMLELGADPLLANQEGDTALHYAARVGPGRGSNREGPLECPWARILIEKGASVEQPNAKGETPVMLAAASAPAPRPGSTGGFAGFAAGGSTGGFAAGGSTGGSTSGTTSSVPLPFSVASPPKKRRKG